MKLIEVPVGSQVQITQFSQTLSEKFQHRLREIGFVEGEIVSCIRRTPLGGPKIFQVGDSVFSIGADVATCINTSPCQ